MFIYASLSILGVIIILICNKLHNLLQALLIWEQIRQAQSILAIYYKAYGRAADRAATQFLSSNRRIEENLLIIYQLLENKRSLVESCQSISAKELLDPRLRNSLKQKVEFAFFSQFGSSWRSTVLKRLEMVNNHFSGNLNMVEEVAKRA